MSSFLSCFDPELIIDETIPAKTVSLKKINNFLALQQEQGCVIFEWGATFESLNVSIHNINGYEHCIDLWRNHDILTFRKIGDCYEQVALTSEGWTYAMTYVMALSA